MITLILLALILLPFILVGGGLAMLWKTRRRRILKVSAIGYLALVGLLLLGLGPYATAWLLTHARTRPPDRQLRDTPADHRIAYEDVVFHSQDSLLLSGWFIPPNGKDAVVICTHGLFRNRIEVLSRIIPLARSGYGALLYDSRSHGGSDLGLVSLGYHERNDVLGAIQFVQRRYQDSQTLPRIVLMGVSMGAVATLEAAAESSSYSALILDSPFLTLRDTIVDHSWLLLGLPRYPFPSLFLFWFERLAEFNPDRVDARKAMERAEPVPVLLIASEGDARIPADVARELLRQSTSAVKELKVFGKDVPHGAAARTHPEEYNRVILAFLHKALGEFSRAAAETNSRGAGPAQTTASSAEAGSPR